MICCVLFCLHFKLGVLVSICLVRYFSLFCQHSFCDVWFCLINYLLMLDFFIASSLSISNSVLYGDILCRMLVTILQWGIPLSLSSLDLLQIFTLLDLFLDLCELSYWGIPSFSILLLGHTPSLGSSYFLLISWSFNLFVDPYELLPWAFPFSKLFYWGMPPFSLSLLSHPHFFFIFFSLFRVSLVADHISWFLFCFRCSWL